VIGDLNQSGILIAKNAMATLIDCDSFQVTVSGRTFLCKVGKEEFTPPELQGIRFDQIVRTSNHDAFGLAVIIFYLLFMGRHPFDGKFVGRGDVPPRPKAISEYRFAYSCRTNDTRMVPPPHVPLLSDLPKELSDAFEIAFGPSGPSRRPTAADWVLMLERAELQVVGCQNNSAHHFFRAAPSCP
jgi:DNA-binding helix-hairpin-helix protein with protein kinase domain